MLSMQKLLRENQSANNENVAGLISPPRRPKFISTTTPNAGESAEKKPTPNSNRKRQYEAPSPQKPVSTHTKKVKVTNKEDLFELQDFIDLAVGQMGRKAYSTASKTLNRLYEHPEYFQQLQPGQLLSIANLYKLASTRPSTTENVYQSLTSLQAVIKNFMIAGKFNNSDNVIDPELQQAYIQNEGTLLELELEKEIAAGNYLAATALFMTLATHPVTHTFNSAKFAAHYITLFTHLAAPKNAEQLEQLQGIAKSHLAEEDPAFSSAKMQESYYYNQHYLDRISEQHADAFDNLIACILAAAEQIQFPTDNTPQKIITSRIHYYIALLEKHIQSFDDLEQSYFVDQFLLLKENLKPCFARITPENRCFADLQYIPSEIYTESDWENIYFSYSTEIDNISNPQERIEKIEILIELMSQDKITANRDLVASRIILLHEDLCTYLESENSNPNTQTASFQKLFDSLTRLSKAIQASTHYAFSKDTQKQLMSAQKRFAGLVIKNETSSASSKIIINSSKTPSSSATSIATPDSVTNNAGAQLQIARFPQPQKHLDSQSLRA